MKLNIQNSKEIEQFTLDNPDEFYLGFTFKLEVRETLDKVPEMHRGQILEKVLDYIESFEYFDDFDDWEFTYSYKEWDTTDTEAIWLVELTVTGLTK